MKIFLIPYKNRWFWYAQLILLLCIFSRGVGELFFGKGIAYVGQAIALSFLFLIFLPFLPWSSRFDAGLFFLIFVSGLVSFLITMFSDGYDLLPSFVVLFVNLLNLYFVYVSICLCRCYKKVGCSSVDRDRFTSVLRIVAVWVFSSSLLAFLGVVEFPGDATYGDYLRLSGSFGSKQHFAIVVSLLAISLYVCFSFSRNSLDLLLSLLLIVVVLFSFTRIGYFFLGFFFFVYFLFASLKNTTIRVHTFFYFLGGLIFVFWVGVEFNAQISVIFERISDFRISEGSNAVRIAAWGHGFDVFSSTPILFSDRLGFASQIPQNLFSIYSSHFESGHIQYLVNFGLIFWLLVIVLFCRLYWSIPNGFQFKFVAILVFLGLMFYMFNEIVPVFAALPFFLFSTFKEVST